MTLPTTAPVSAQLRVLADPIWAAQFEHPFVRGLSDGSLDVERFGMWLKQDYLFLIEYSRSLASAVVRAPDLATMRGFSNVLPETLTSELELHRSYVATFGITNADLERESMAPTTQGYADFLLRTAATGDFAELVAAVLPCMWGYSELGQALHRKGLPDDERYARWIETYSSAEFAELAQWCRDLLDRIASGLPSDAMSRVAHAFLTSSKYELAFWEMAWHGERWPSETLLG